MTFAPLDLDDGAEGPERARNLLWQHTVWQVSCVLLEAERRIRDPERRNYYEALEGWWRPKKTRLPNGSEYKIPSETALSEAIVEEVQRIREEAFLQSHTVGDEFKGLERLEFSLEVPRQTKGGIGRHSKPTDIRVYRLGSEILDLRIEAKCVVKTGDILQSYLSKKGLGRFSDAKEPYTSHEVGGMLAYTICKDRLFWLRKIESTLIDYCPSMPIAMYPLDNSLEEMMLCKVPNEVCGDSGAGVLVFHLALEFDSLPSAR